MLFLPTEVLKPLRIQGAFISENEVEKIVKFLKANGGAVYSEDVLEKIEKANTKDREINEEDDIDPFLMEAIEMVVEMRTSISIFYTKKV